MRAPNPRITPPLLIHSQLPGHTPPHPTRWVSPHRPPSPRAPTRLLQALLARSLPITAWILFASVGFLHVRALDFPPGLTNDTRLTNIVVITNDVPLPPPIVTFPSPVHRDIGSVPVSINFGMPVSAPVSLEFHVVGGTATPLIDYITPPVFHGLGPGSAEVIVPVPILLPPTNRPPADILFGISWSTPGNLPMSAGPFAILLNDIIVTNPPKLTNVVFFSSVSPIQVDAGPAATSVTLEIGRAPTDATPASVRVVSVDGSAKAGVDFVALDQVVTFGPANSRATTSLEIHPDPHIGLVPRSFTVELRDPVNAVLSEPTRITIIIVPGPEGADLSLSASTPTPEAVVGDTIIIRTAVANAGPAAALGVAARQLLPPSISFVSASAPAPITYDPISGRWDLGLLDPGALVELELRARADAPFDGILPMEIIASGAPDPDSVPNNGAPAEDDIAFVAFKAEEELADLQLTFQPANTTTNVTNKLTITLVLENLGPRNARDISIENVVPPGLTLDANTPGPGTAFNAATGTWTVPALNNGARSTLQLVLKPQRGGHFTNVASIKASKPRDPEAGNNRAEVPLFFVGYSACGIARVCNNVTNQPNPNAAVVLDGPLKLNGTTDALGAFCFTNLLPGKYKLTITPANPASGIEIWSEDIDVDAAGATIDATSNWLIVVGRVTLGTNGPPVSGLTIEAVNGAEKHSARTDANGEYRIVPIGKKAYDVTIKDLPAGLTARPPLVSVDPTANFDTCPPRADFVLSGRLSISGVVRACNARGPFLPSAVVTITGKDLTFTQAVRTGADGRYAFRNLPPGRYTVSISHPNHTFNPRSVDITLVRDNVTRNFIGDPERSLAGRVLLGNGQPFSGVEIVVLEAQPFGPPVRRTTTTDVNGEWVLKPLPAGLYEIAPTPPDSSITFTPRFLRFLLGGPGGDCGNFLTFRANRNAVEIVAIEAVQVIQDWQNNVPLVQDKPTLVRAFVKPTGTNRTPVVVNNARLRVERNGRLVGLYGSESGGVSARHDYALRRNMPETSIPFRLPADALRGTNTLTLEWPGGSLTTATPPGQTAVRNNRTEVQFKPMPEIPIRWVLVSWTFGGTTKAATEALASRHRSRVLAGFPTARLPSVAASQRALDWRPGADPTDPANDANMQLSSSLLRLLARLKRDDLIDARGNSIYYGVVDGANLRGAGDITGGQACFADVSALGDARRNLPIHELGHALGRHHAVHSAFGIRLIQGTPFKKGLCNEIADAIAPDFPMDTLGSDLLAPVLGPMRLGEYRYAYGWDSGLRLYVSPFSTPDIMSYCTTFGRDFKTDWSWPGIFSYTGMMNAAQARFGPRVAPRALAAPAGNPVPVVRISGMLDGDGRLVEFDPVSHLLEDWSPTESGEFQLQLLDAQSNILAEQPFDAAAIAPDALGSDSRFFREFVASIPWNDATAALEIHRAGLLVARLALSPGAPSVTWTTPSGSIPVPLPPTGLPISWSAQDPDGDRLLARIESSEDDGATWTTLALDITEPFFVLRPDHFPHAGTARLRVTVSDGFRSASALLDTPVLLPDKAPALSILEPAGDAPVSTRSAVQLRADAWDPEDGAIESIQWSSDLAGPLGEGTGLTLAPGTLAPGTHTLTARVTDASGNSTTDSATLQIIAPATPTLRLLMLADTVELRWTDDAILRSVEAAYELDPSEWFPLEVESELEGDDHVVRLPIDEEQARFYRLVPVPTE